MNKKIILVLVIFLFSILCLQNISIALSTTIEKSKENQKLVSTSSKLPDYFSWNDINGVDFTTPVRMQQPYSSCETFAFVAALEVMVQWKVGYPFGCDLSEAHLYFWSGGNNGWGSFPENDTNYLVEYGVPDEACWPYPNYLDEAAMFPKNTTCANWQERTVKIKNWSYLPAGDINAIKQALVNNGPVPAHLNSYADFGYYSGGVYTHKWGESQALHCVCIMGYQDDPSIPSGGYWIVKNSWGTHLRSGRAWGEEGWVKIAYGEASIEEMALLFEDVYGQFPILYVDDDNIIGPWDGSKEYPYQTISGAINKAYEGWTVFVKNGTYTENLVINKTINLDGENPETTIIDGCNNGIVIYVQKPDVRISGFTIQNSGSKRLDSGIKTLSLDSNLLVKNCIIKDCDVGIYLNCADFETYTDTKNTIVNNTIKDNSIGIFTTWVQKNIIQGNKIYNNSLHGIEMEASKYSIIQKNEIYNNKEVGINIHGSCDETEILSNLIKNNSCGLIIKETKNCKIKENNFVDNTQQASFIRSRGNKWNGNFWSEWDKLLPYLIRGSINLGNISWINFDWRPSAQLI
jgi:parallel beta-helix repeat protein